MRRFRSRGGESIRRDSGAVLVEFALLLPIFLILVLGIINFGYLFGQQLSLNQAVREGARKSVVKGSGVIDATGIQSAVQNAVGPQVSPSTAVATTASPNANGCAGMVAGRDLTVTASFAARPLIPWVFLPLPDTFNLTSTAVFRCEWGGTG